MKVIIIDDDKSMLLIMQKMLSKVPEVELCGAFMNTVDAYEFMLRNDIELAFVDISMPEESGLEFARRIVTEIPMTDIVFLTAYKEFALEAFDVHAFDYIVKPVMKERLEQTIKRAVQRRNASKKGEGITAKLSIYCFGEMDIRSSDGTLVKLSSTKSSELLAYLLMHRGKPVSKWSVMEMIFRGMPIHNAETYLNTTVYKLRKAFEPYGLKSAIISANESYSIDMKEIYVDFLDFEMQLSKFRTINAQNAEAASSLEKLYVGGLFGGGGYHWCLPDTERLLSEYSQLAKRLCTYYIDENSLIEALRIAKKLADYNELDEEANIMLLRIYAAQRDKVSIIRQYERYAKILKRELGIAPEKEMIKLFSELMSSLDV